MKGNTAWNDRSHKLIAKLHSEIIASSVSRKKGKPLNSHSQLGSSLCYNDCDCSRPTKNHVLWFPSSVNIATTKKPLQWLRSQRFLGVCSQWAIAKESENGNMFPDCFSPSQCGRCLSVCMSRWNYHPAICFLQHWVNNQLFSCKWLSATPKNYQVKYSNLFIPVNKIIFGAATASFL